ncbi:MAG TPA: RNA pseudouridine synthase, partial [Treponemataceae bacterium]|nr:RNA pseudouridine synthase [Treponemataceae bacterium]
NKPYDVSVQAANKNELSLDTIIQQNTITNSLSFRPGPLHRLDRRTTGVLVFSQSLAGAQWFSKAIKEKSIQREYVGLLCGHLEEVCVWENYIDDTYKKTGNFRTVEVVKNSSQGKEAITYVSPLAVANICALNKKIPVTLVSFRIETGRMHQIRAQASFYNHPLAGDSAYSSDKYTDVYLNTFNINRCVHAASIPEFLLHAIQLKIPTNPVDLPSIVTAPIPCFFKTIIETYFASFDVSSYNGVLYEHI